MEDAAIGILQPVLESSMIVAAHYCKACGRSAVTAKDVVYGMMFAAKNVTGKKIGSLFPEIYDESESESDDIEEVDDDEDPWTRYEGPDEMMNQVNDCADGWDAWEPESPIEQSIKRAINSSIRDNLS